MKETSPVLVVQLMKLLYRLDDDKLLIGINLQNAIGKGAVTESLLAKQCVTNGWHKIVIKQVDYDVEYGRVRGNDVLYRVDLIQCAQ